MSLKTTIKGLTNISKDEFGMRYITQTISLNYIIPKMTVIITGLTDQTRKTSPTPFSWSLISLAYYEHMFFCQWKQKQKK